MDGFKRRTEHKKQQILKVAQAKLQQGSYQTATIKEIASDAGVSQVSIYNYFGSKDELLYEAISVMMEEQLKQYEGLLEQQLPYPKLMYAVMNEESKFIKVINDCLKQASDAGEIQERVYGFLEERFIPFLMKLINRGGEEGYMAADLKQDELLFYFSMYQQAMSSFYETERSNRVMLSEERFIQFFFSGLLGEGFIEKR
ncbi:TetR/AcrR family transcriptional regulator [Paenibacillus sp. J5C_2022]|uniref:TetR/AcrR family transcriptional regulator n=1 Tax=Paenibacillus sp. J5C2022 TaxID=2977129 RepID=UPI0021CF5577|nr:TetR/AcrR family transcriptional regulator [Paenibacillus sp. J5C2022]MCU6707276.1 TetR/AcrR family transcriptional regulator [Paenibacillus sp. J5C2022]